MRFIGGPIIRTESDTLKQVFSTIEDVPSTKIRALHAYWRELARERFAPRKSEIDPARLKQLLPYLIITQIFADPLRIFYRLLGTRVVQVWQVDWTGRYMHEGPWTAEQVTEDEAAYGELLRTRQPIFAAESLTWPWHDPEKMRLPYYWGYFPLSDDGETVTHCLAIEDTEGIDVAAIERQFRISAKSGPAS